jgi:hypothetical protein
VILSIMYQVSLQVLFIDSTSTLRAFNVDITGPSNLKLTLSAFDNGYDVCYSKVYIQNAAFTQKILKGLIEAVLASVDSKVNSNGTKFIE